MAARFLFPKPARVSVFKGIFDRIQKARRKKMKILVHYVSKSRAGLQHCVDVLPNKFQKKK